MDEYPEVPVVHYADIYDDIQNGDILFCAGSSAMSRLIQEATDSIWSHVGFLMRYELIRAILVFESVESVGVAPVGLEHYVSNYQFGGKGYPGRVFIGRDARFATLTPAQLTQFSQTAVSLFRRQYDMKQLAGIAWRLMCQKLGLPVPPRTHDAAYICSEHLETCQVAADLQTEALCPGFIAPRDFAVSRHVRFLWELALAT